MASKSMKNVLSVLALSNAVWSLRSPTTASTTNPAWTWPPIGHGWGGGQCGQNRGNEKGENE